MYMETEEHEERGRPENTYHANDVWWAQGGHRGRGPHSNNVLDFIIKHSNNSVTCLHVCYFKLAIIGGLFVLVFSDSLTMITTVSSLVT